MLGLFDKKPVFVGGTEKNKKEIVMRPFRAELGTSLNSHFGGIGDVEILSEKARELGIYEEVKDELGRLAIMVQQREEANKDNDPRGEYNCFG